MENVPGEKESDWELPNLIHVSREELGEMMENGKEFYVYFGRPSCPDCLEFYPKFKSILGKSNTEIYYYSTEAKASEKSDMSEFVKPFGLKEVPSILYIKGNMVAKIYDGQNEEDLNEFEKIVS
jgi:predicted bacteriocin transport accessory protein